MIECRRHVLVRVDSEDNNSSDLLESDKIFYIRKQFIGAFANVKPIIKNGRVQGYSIPRENFEGGDPTKEFALEEQYTAHELRQVPTEEEAILNRARAVLNANRFGWSEKITIALKRNGDKILKNEVTRDMICFGAGNDALLMK